MNRLPILDDADGSVLPVVFLYPGALRCARRPSVVTTVLGSCVAVCLTDRSRRLSGINHFLLPRSDSDKPSLRYGDVSIDRLLKKMLNLGSQKEDIEAKIFGGAAVLPANNPEESIGTKNVAAAVERLGQHGIPIVARHTGGTSGMVLRLFTATGDVLVRRVASMPEQRATKKPLKISAGR